MIWDEWPTQKTKMNWSLWKLGNFPIRDQWLKLGLKAVSLSETQKCVSVNIIDAAVNNQ